MPIYEYECKSCIKVFEVQQRMSDAPMDQCPDCGGRVQKLVSRSAFHLKGGGWYSDGYSGGRPCQAKETPGETAKTETPAPPPCQSGGSCASCPAAA